MSKSAPETRPRRLRGLLDETPPHASTARASLGGALGDSIRLPTALASAFPPPPALSALPSLSYTCQGAKRHIYCRPAGFSPNYGLRLEQPSSAGRTDDGTDHWRVRVGHPGSEEDRETQAPGA